MSEVVRRDWLSDLSAGLSRRDRLGCGYEAYIPDLLTDRRFRFDGDVAADLVEAEAAIVLLNEKATALRDTEALARLLLRAECVASSQIEGLEVGGRRLLRAEAAREAGVPAEDVTAEEVLGNIEAMRWAVDGLGSAEVITVDGLLEVHRRLLARTRLAEHGGKIREQQNWIGGSAFNPCSAVFVPPPHEEVERLLQDLCDFCNSDLLPAVAQAAIAHAQFETIHPFIDGNGRTGRALLHVILKRRGLVPRVLAPVSLVLATWSTSYIGALMGTRYLGDPDSEGAVRGTDAWVGLFSAACKRAVSDATAFEEGVQGIQETWRSILGKIRRNSAADLLIAALPGAPIITVASAARLIGRSYQATNEGIERLRAAGVLSQVRVGRRNRAFEARDAIDAFTNLERQLASPEGDTRSSEPSRTVPRRRQLPQA
jgi:Fic family protein